MNYLQIINLIFTVLGAIVLLATMHFMIFAIVGIFAKKKFPKTETKLKYGIIIPARNEEAVVGNLIKSVYKNKYPQDKLQVFVIAHNCTDKTAQISRELGATVYEYNNPNECTMGYAFRHLFKCIEKDYGTQNYDGFFLFNADNVLDENYFDKMNDAFVAENKESVITSFRNSKNFGSNVMSGLYGMYFASGCRLESRGRTVCGCSTRVQGTGYVISSKVVKDGWPYVTLTEDWEFSADQILHGNKIKYCDDAVFYDEQPTTTKVMLRQRIRWAKGHLLVCLSKTKQLFARLFKRSKNGKSNKVSTYDIFINIMPLCVISACLTILNFIMLLFCPLFGFSLKSVLFDYLIGFANSLLFGYISMFISGVIIFILERKRIKNVKFYKKVLMAFAWPIFIALSIPIEFVALFSRNVGWKTIPHTDTTTFEKVNDMQEETKLLEPEKQPEETVVAEYKEIG